MDFYEELGVLPSASEAEIRASYKRLTLLLHPDQQQREEVRLLAERQMKRLNEMIALLTNPEQRRIYDNSLQNKTLIVRQTAPVPCISWIRNNRGWTVVGVAFVMVLISAVLVPRFDSARSAAKMRVSASPQAPEKLAMALPRPAVTELWPRGVARSSATIVQKPAAGTPLTALASLDGVVPQASVGPQARTLAVEPALPARPVEALPQSSPGSFPATQTLAGRWIYTPDPSDFGDAKLFPAEYVELSILLNGNRMHGVYQSRYKLADHRLNSHVNFTFEGSGSATSFVWQGDSGAQGEVAIRLEPAGTLHVSWFATAMGSALSLGSGSATLYRFQ